MESSIVDGKHMDIGTFRRAVVFAKFIGSNSIIVSGGEPTTHPDFFMFCKALNDVYQMLFSVVSNGTWCLESSWNDDIPKIERQIRRMCSDFKYFVGMQVYTNKLFYKDYDKIHEKKPFFDSFGGKVKLDESPIRSMQDLGRARICDVAQNMCDESKYHMSCLNAALIAKQVRCPQFYGWTIELKANQFCHPMVDFNGDVHLSESWHCQSVGNVNTDIFSDIWDKIKAYKPCGECKGCQRFFKSDDPNIIHARKIITM
jgi:MoaA/NifB/PqqE/SkfB family radical SAM enzyme